MSRRRPRRRTCTSRCPRGPRRRPGRGSPAGSACRATRRSCTRERPSTSCASVNEVFEKVLEHERKVTALVNDLSALAHEEKDRAAEIFLQWFVSEQVEEEARVVEIVDRLRMVGDRPGAALYLDKEYGKRRRTA